MEWDRRDDGVHTPCATAQWWDGAEVGEEVNFLHTNCVQSKPFIKKGPIDDGHSQLEISILVSVLWLLQLLLICYWLKLNPNIERIGNSNSWCCVIFSYSIITLGNRRGRVGLSHQPSRRGRGILSRNLRKILPVLWPRDPYKFPLCGARAPLIASYGRRNHMWIQGAHKHWLPLNFQLWAAC